MITYKYLPSQCYSAKATRKIIGVVLHYISLKNVLPKDPFNPDMVWLLIRDLNMEPGERYTHLLKNQPKTYASYHWLITRDHGRPWELVHPHWIAHHAYPSEFKGRQGVNAFMLGIAMIATHDSGYTANQVNVCAHLCRGLQKEYGFPAENIVGHSDVSPGRKIDPGPMWDWQAFRGKLG